MIIERFRTWYEHERDCNAKILVMLRSVPEERRSEPSFARAVLLMSHLVAARRIWLDRVRPDGNGGGRQYDSATIDDLDGMVSAIESDWTEYLERLTDADLAREFAWTRVDGSSWSWNVEEMLVQVHGHGWYHRGQIVLLVDLLGGETVNTDFMLWTPNVHADG